MAHGSKQFESPPPSDIYKARTNAHQLQKNAADIVYVNRETWSGWERGKNKMPPGLFELYLIKTGAR